MLVRVKVKKKTYQLSGLGMRNSRSLSQR